MTPAVFFNLCIMKTNYLSSFVLVTTMFSCTNHKENPVKESKSNAPKREQKSNEVAEVEITNNRGELIIEDKFQSLASVPPPTPPERYLIPEPDPFGPIGSAVDIYFDDMMPVFEQDTLVVKRKPPADDFIYEIVDKEATYPGGITELMKFIIDNFEYPQEHDVIGKVYIRFAIMKSGAIENIKVLKGVSPAVDNEARRVIALMPDWIPAENNGQIVNSWVTIPISIHPSK